MPRLQIALAVSFAFVATPILAKPPHKQAVVGHLGPFFPKALNSCVLCHLPDSDKVEGKPHNPFGARLKSLRIENEKAGKKFDIPTCFDAIAEEDSDGDGVPNLIEILTGHFPGDAKDKPTLEEISQAKRTLTDYRKFRSAYPWRPYDMVTWPPLPAVKNSSWVRNPIDAFIAAEHVARGLKPRPEADKSTLLRRVYLDLIGLPPTPQELHAFLNDSSSIAYEKVVDRLLLDPRYGERWGRHWMDVWRYSDWAGWTDGGQIRDSQPHIWHWRDWIVESLNSDMGYDRMILEMLAGDEFAPGDEATLRATGFLARNYKMLSREKWLEDTVEHTFLAFQATTIGCARCHDHMFDPILQKEYYEVRAIFTPHQVRLDRIPGQPNTKVDGIPRVYDADLNSPTYLLIRGDDRNPDKKSALPPGVPKALGGRYSPHAVKLPRDAYLPDRREFVGRETLAQSRVHVIDATQAVIPWRMLATAFPVAVQLERAELELAVAETKHAALAAVLRVEALEDAGKKNSPEWQAAATATTIAQRAADLAEAKRNLFAGEQAERIAKKKAAKDAATKKLGEARKQLAAAEKASKDPPSTAYRPWTMATYPAESSGRRLAFAKWLASTQNPLTARVAVNQIWMRHFSQAIVPSVFDFGHNGRAPSHPALLDWLAAQLMSEGWHMKPLHRLIVTSATYRQASTPDAADLAIDRDNVYYWRMSPHRLEAELVRDSVLYVAGKLDPALGGPDIDYHLGMKVFRRSMYFRHAAEKEMEFLKLFDAASVTECYQRKASIIPQQALALFNSEMTVRMGRLLARELNRSHADSREFVTAAFDRTLSRAPTSAEIAECLEFLDEQAKQHAAASKGADDADGRQPSHNPQVRAREGLVMVLLNHHEFVTVR